MGTKKEQVLFSISYTNTQKEIDRLTRAVEQCKEQLEYVKQNGENFEGHLAILTKMIGETTDAIEEQQTLSKKAAKTDLETIQKQKKLLEEKLKLFERQKKVLGEENAEFILLSEAKVKKELSNLELLESEVNL